MISERCIKFGTRKEEYRYFRYTFSSNHIWHEMLIFIFFDFLNSRYEISSLQKIFNLRHALGPSIFGNFYPSLSLVTHFTKQANEGMSPFIRSSLPKYTFSSNHNIHKSLCGLYFFLSNRNIHKCWHDICFWASDLLIEKVQ